MGSRATLDGSTSAFLAPSIRRMIGPDLTGVATYMYAIESVQDAYGSREERASFETVCRLYVAKMSIEHRLLSIPFRDDKVHERTAEQDAVRLALYLTPKSTYSMTRIGSPFGQSMARQVRVALEKTDLASLWHPCEKLLLWVLFVLLYHSYGQEEWPWGIEYLTKVSKAMRIESVEEMRGCLEEFGVLDTARLSSMLHGIWTDVERRG